MESMVYAFRYVIFIFSFDAQDLHTDFTVIKHEKNLQTMICKVLRGAYRIRTGDLYNANVARYRYVRIVFTRMRTLR